MSAGNIGLDELPRDREPLPQSLTDRSNLSALLIYAAGVICALYWLAV